MTRLCVCQMVPLPGGFTQTTGFCKDLDAQQVYPSIPVKMLRSAFDLVHCELCSERAFTLVKTCVSQVIFELQNDLLGVHAGDQIRRQHWYRQIATPVAHAASSMGSQVEICPVRTSADHWWFGKPRGNDKGREPQPVSRVD